MIKLLRREDCENFLYLKEKKDYNEIIIAIRLTLLGGLKKIIVQ